MNKKYHVQGMTCTSCEVLIERNLKKLPGLEKVNVSQAKGEVEIESSRDIPLEELQQAIAEKGYVLSAALPESQQSHQHQQSAKDRWAEIGAVAVILFSLYFILKQFNIVPDLGVTDTMSYGFIFVIGLVAATSTCLAVAGGLLLGIAQKYNEKYPHLRGIQKFRPHIYFNIGRIVSYTLLGALVGLLGSVFTFSPRITGIITIVASVLMILMGLQLLHIFPWLNTLHIKMPKFIAHKVYTQSEQNTGGISSFFFGAATFFLPCGFTQALQLYVLGKGDPLVGALTMLAFSIGTLPSLVGVGLFSSFAKGNAQRYFMTFSAVLIIVLGIFNLPNGFALTGMAVANVPDSGNVAVPLTGETQVVEMRVVGLEYYPANFKVQQGIPVEWRVDGSKAQGCAQVLILPDLGIREYLPRQGIKTITFTPTEAGFLRFSCTMGMTTSGAGFEVVESIP